MKKIIAIALIAIVAITELFAAVAGNTIKINAGKAIDPVVLTLYAKKSTETDYATSDISYTTMPSSFVIDFKVGKDESNYTGNTADLDYTVTVGPLFLGTNTTGVEGETKVTPTLGTVTGGTKNGLVVSGSVEIKGYKAANDEILSFSATYTIPTTLEAGNYVSTIVLSYTTV